MGRISTAAGALALAAVVPLAAAACGESSGGDGAEVEAGRPADFAATPDYLASAIDDSEGLPHRYEGFFEFDIEGMGSSGDEPLMTGATDGERNQLHIDFGVMFDGLPDTGLPEDADLTMDIVSDASTVYIRSPFLATMASEMPGSGATEELAEVMDVFETLGDRWATIDLTAVEGVLPEEIGKLFGSGQNMDPAVFLDIIRQTDDVEDLGGDEIDGEPVTGMAVSVSVVQMLEAQGLDPESELGDVPAEVRSALDDFEFDVEVWIDSEARIRNVVVDMGDAIAEVAEEMDEEIDGGSVDFVITLDFFDYGDESIVVEVPADAQDITQDLLGLLEGLDD